MHKKPSNTPRRNTLLVIAVLAGLMCLAGCGQKGPLVLPKAAPQTTPQ